VKLDIITKGRQVYSGDVEGVVLPALEGEMGVLAGHADFIVMLKKGTIRVIGRAEAEVIPVEGGYAEVTQDGVLVLTALAA
jgi:F-type H+-transporting ATPase subunit epsilon